MAEAERWTNRAFLRGDQYKTDANLSARQSIYAFRHPPADIAATVLDLVAPGPSDTVVDVGCGNGIYLAELARRGLGARVLGLDLSYGMLTAARDRLPAASRRPQLAGADAVVLPVRDAVADMTLSMHMLYHVPEPARALRELRRVTRPGGRVVIGLNGDRHLKQLRAVLAAVGGEDPRSMGEALSLDDGHAMAGALFPSVTRHDIVGELRVPAAGPIADYVRSIYGASRRTDAERIVTAVLAAFPRSADGHYVITTHAGCLICETS